MSKSVLLKISILFSATIFSIAILSACKCRVCQQEEEGTVPLEVLTKADSFIVASTGKEFFDKYITADFARTKYTPPYYEMAYKLFIPDKPYVNATIKFTVDTTGNVIKNRDIVGIPRCTNFPYECDFNIDEGTARLIATKMGLKEGIREWDAGFMWDFKFQRYVWKILSTLTELGEGDHYKATGQEIIIDPNTGEMLALNDWRIN
jgi:hypothetical protein